MLSSEEIERLKTLLSDKKKIVITTHYNPDGDAMGSSLGLYHYLKSKKHHVTVITPNSWPSFLDWMPGADSCLAGDHHLKKAHRILEEADIVFINATCYIDDFWLAINDKIDQLKVGARIILASKRLKGEQYVLIDAQMAVTSWGTNSIFIYKKIA